MANENRSNWDSEKIKQAVREKRVACGYKITRQLRAEEQRAFLEEDKIPADALSASTFIFEKEKPILPDGVRCMCCGADIGGKSGFIVEVKTDKGNQYNTICHTCHDVVIGGGTAEADDELATPEPAPAPATEGEDGGLQAALKTITAALAAPKAPPVNEAKIIAEACARARAAAAEVMNQSVKDFITKGKLPACGSSASKEKPLPPAVKSGVDVTAKASGWSAKASADGKTAVEKLNAFLSEFSFFRDGVSMRFINTFARAKDKASKEEFLKSYCAVAQMEDYPDLVEKMKSPEFKQVCDLFKTTPSRSVNNRLAVFYGSPGGGKTYAAEEACKVINGGEYETMVCSPSMDASDMLYAYRLDYETDKRGYVPTGLLKAMLAGRAVVLDEINLLPMEARMFLQNILDNKSKVSVMGVELPIKEGFFVIGTMNLETGMGMAPLPLPLVDRACVVKEFKTTAAQAAVGAGLC